MCSLGYCVTVCNYCYYTYISNLTNKLNTILNEKYVYLKKWFLVFKWGSCFTLTYRAQNHVNYNGLWIVPMQKNPVYNKVIMATP